METAFFERGVSVQPIQFLKWLVANGIKIKIKGLCLAYLLPQIMKQTIQK
jgi:hypothetical protein